MGVAPRAQPMRLAEKLLDIRIRLDLGQAPMADALTAERSVVDGGAVSRFETGKREPSLITLLKYARLARIPMEVLVDDKLDLPWK